MSSEDTDLRIPLPSTRAEIDGAIEGEVRERLARAPTKAWLASVVTRRVLQLVPDSGPGGHYTRAGASGGPLLDTSWACLLESLPTPLDREIAATGLVFAALRARQQIVGGTWAPDEENGEPLDNGAYDRFFGFSVAPDTRKSLAIRQAYSRHIIVAVAGRFFRVEMVVRGKAIARAALLAALRGCVAQANRTPCGLGGLSAAGAADLYEGYRELCAVQDNLSSLRMLADSILVLCLDDTSPDSDVDVGYELQSGRHDNRWHLHATQLVVFRNSRAGIVGNTAIGLFGQPALRLASAIAAEWPVLCKFKGTDAGPAPIFPLLWQVRSSRRRSVEQFCESLYEKSPDNILSLPFSSRDAQALGIGKNTAFFLLLHAAFAEHLDGSPPGAVFQLVSERHLQGGSVGDNRVTRPSMLEFAGMLRASARPEQLRRVAQQAEVDYRRGVFDAKMRHTQRYILHDEANQRLPRRWFSLVSRGLTAMRAERELLRVSQLTLPPGVRLIGRFGVRAGVPTSIWGHPFFRPDSTLFVATQGTQAPLSRAEFRARFTEKTELLRRILT